MNTESDVARATAWGAITGAGAAATASMLDNIDGLPFLAWTATGLALGALIAYSMASLIARLDRIDRQRQERVAAHIARMERRFEDTKRRAA